MKEGKRGHASLPKLASFPVMKIYSINQLNITKL
jgi:hypothetical protein